VIARVQALGYHIQVEEPERIRSLDSSSIDWVYLVPLEASLADPEWPETRVQLARASRYYVVFGEGLGTADVMAAARDGAFDVLDAADADERWSDALEEAARSQALWWQLYGAQQDADPRSLVGRSTAMASLRESIQRIGPTDATVLVAGESGVGKERVAEALHAASGRSAFVSVNCAAIPGELLESELFGVEKGAYTGANRSKPGLVEEAENGTLFLDEIGEMALSLQPKLLRFLETRRARRIGSTKEYPCNVRVISATNRDLQLEAEQKRFRPDLFYRLSEVTLTVPPLRHRSEDIADLAKLFIGMAAERHGKVFETLEPELIERFRGYRWPGNVRELKQAIDRLAIHYNGPVLRASWWEPPLTPAQRAARLTNAPFPVSGGSPRGTAGPFSRGTTTAPFAAQSAAPGPHSQPGFPHPPPAANPYAAGPFTQPGGVYSPLVPSGTAGAGMLSPSGAAAAGMPPHPPTEGRVLNKKEKMERARQLLEQSDGDLGWTAAQMGIHPSTLYRWRKSGKV